MKVYLYCKVEKDEAEFVYRLHKITNCCILCKRIQNAEYERKHRIEAKNRKKKYLINTPWYVSMMGAKTRCNNKNNKDYKNYGGRGIKFLMTSEEMRFLWFRDKAYLMEQPSIDRIDNNGNYEINNCRFLEMIDNVKRQFEVSNEKN